MGVIAQTNGTPAAFPNVSALATLAAGSGAGLGAVASSAATNYRVDVSLTCGSAPGNAATVYFSWYLIESSNGTTYTDGVSPTLAATALASIPLANAREIKRTSFAASAVSAYDSFCLPVIDLSASWSLIGVNNLGVALTAITATYTPAAGSY
jgi:hypothetical protein